MRQAAGFLLRFAIIAFFGVALAGFGSVHAGQDRPPANYPAGTGPDSLAIGDFNEDGIPDLAVANSNLFGNGESSVSVLLGKGNGGFQSAVDYPAGKTPRSVAVGDFNEDGHLDMVVANESSNNVSLLLGNGDGTFQPAINISAGTGPFFVAVADFNGDHHLDMAVANFAEAMHEGRVTVFLGNGNGGFEKPVVYNLGSNVRTHMIAVADVNGDGHLDLVVANAGILRDPGKISVLFGKGDGSFGEQMDFKAGQDPFSVAVADLNGDGMLDLAVADESVDQVSVLIGNGQGMFGKPVMYATGTLPFSIVAADFNGDGKMDLATANENSNDVTVLLGLGDGIFGAPRSIPADQAPQYLLAADLNGDGRTDAAVANLISNDVTVLLNPRRR